MRFILFFFLVAISANLFAQDDDFFLRSEDDQIKESSTFEEVPADGERYYDDIIRRTLMDDYQILEYEPLREIDVMWQKRIWRVIDTREKMNIAFRNEDKPLFTIFKDLYDNGEIALFRDEKFKEKLSLEEVSALNIFSKIDTTTTYDPDTYEEKLVITNSDTDPFAIGRYRVKEVWFFDKESSVVNVRILGVAPVIDEYDKTTGEWLFERPLFWIYYPEARGLLAKYKVPNDFNDVAPMSWYDLFESRFFASYIYKASNSLGLALKEHFKDSLDPNYDVLLESELIKQELFNWEHDLWTY